VEALLVIVDIKWAVELIFRTFEPVLHLSRWVELGGRREAASFISAVSAVTHLLPRISLDQVIAVELNFATFEPVQH